MVRRTSQRLATAIATVCALFWGDLPGVFSAPDCLADPDADACVNPADLVHVALDSDAEATEQGAAGDHLKLLQRQARTETDRTAFGEEVATEDAQGPFWRLKMREQEEAQQQQQQQQQQPPQQQPPPQQGPEPELTKAINRYLYENVVSLLNEGLPDLIQKDGLDPMQEVVQMQNLGVSAMTGMSSINVTAFALRSLTLKLDTSAFSGSASFDLRATIPAMKAKVSRLGVLGLNQHYQLSIGEASLSVGLESSLSLAEGKVHIAHASSPESSVHFASMHLSSEDAPRFELRRLTREVEEGQQSIQGKAAADLKTAVLKRISKALPISLNLTMLT